MAMRRGLAEIKSLMLDPLGVKRMELSCKTNLIPSPGQVSLALLPESDQTIRYHLYPTDILDTGFVSDRVPEDHWLPGVKVDLYGPIGRGFDPPNHANRWLLISFGVSPSRLLPLIDVGMTKGTSLSLWTDVSLAGLPEDIEILPTPDDAIDWADYIAINFSRHPLDNLSGILPALHASLNSIPVEILLDTEMPCGIGACDACWLRTKSSWKRTCLDGPVFELKEVWQT